MDVGRRLTEQGLTLALAESCSGGLIAHTITMTPGSATYFLGGVVSYADTAKERLLGVAPAVLAANGAVSEPVAARMAAGARSRLGADMALSVTGIAGPAGGTAEKPVGLVFMGFANPRGEVNVRQFKFDGDRRTVKAQTCQAALEWLQAYLTKRVAPQAN